MVKEIDHLKALRNRVRSCTRCKELAAMRTQVVVYRGPKESVDILFIGEAPGRSEDSLGEPFIGEAGRFMDESWTTARQKLGAQDLTFGFSNVCWCLPLADEGDRKVLRKPTLEECENCYGWLETLIDLVNPAVIAALGRRAEGVLRARGIDHTAVMHPSRIIRTGRKSAKQYETFLGQLMQAAMKAVERR